MNTGKQDTGMHVYRKLSHFFENKIPVHFCLLAGGWKNGKILDLSESKLTLVLKEFQEGIIPFLLEDIDEKTIKAYREKEEVGK